MPFDRTWSPTLQGEAGLGAQPSHTWLSWSMDEPYLQLSRCYVLLQVLSSAFLLLMIIANENYDKNASLPMSSLPLDLFIGTLLWPGSP